MAKAVRSKVVRTSVRNKLKTNPKKEKTTKKITAAVKVQPKIHAKGTAKTLTPAAKVVAKGEKTKAPKEAAGKKTVSQKLIETIEKRKAAQQDGKGGKALPFSAPPKRRGRRPKNIEYTPENREEEEAYASDSEYEGKGIEYDTGIRVKESGGEDRGFSFERFEDFDEELNFDW